MRRKYLISLFDKIIHSGYNEDAFIVYKSIYEKIATSKSK